MLIKHRIWLTDEQKKIAARRYISGESPDAIAESFGVCANNIRNALRQQGVEMRDRSAARTKLHHRRDAFDVVTPDSAYWIGFIFADGALSNPKIGAPTLTVGLARCDRHHLEKLRAFLESEHVITNYWSTIRKKRHPMTRYAIRSKPIGDALFRHGMRKKSLARIAPEWLLTSRDFWRGVVDGDGHIGISNGKVRLGICGGKILMQQFLTYMNAKDIAIRTKRRRQGVIFRVDLGCNTAIRGIRLLYANCSTALDRKAERARQLSQ